MIKLRIPVLYVSEEFWDMVQNDKNAMMWLGKYVLNNAVKTEVDDGLREVRGTDGGEGQSPGSPYPPPEEGV